MILWVAIWMCALAWGLGWDGRFLNRYKYRRIVATIVSALRATSAITLGILLSVMIISHVTFPEYLAEADALRLEMEVASGSDVSPMERAILRDKVVEFNVQLAKDKYWLGNRWTSMLFPKGITDIEPLGWGGGQ